MLMYSSATHRVVSLLSVVGLVALIIAGCGSSPNASGNGTKSYTFELITKSNASPYWLAVKTGAEAAAKKLGNISVRFEAPASGTDLATQISMVDNAVTSHVDGIILAAQNPSALVSPVSSAKSAGIPVVTVDSGISPNTADSFLATSNIQSSAQLAQEVAKLAGGTGDYAIIDFNKEASTGIERPQGFQQGMRNFPNMKFVGMQLSNNDIPTARSETEAFLARDPNITMMFGANDRSAIGIADAIQAAHLNHKVFIAGFDADLGEVNFIKQGIIAASVLQSPYQMGYQAVQELVQIKQGKSVPKQVNTPYLIVTPQNITTSAAIKSIQQYIPSYTG